MLGFTWC